MADAWTTVVEVEPEWDEPTRNHALALNQYDDECCSGCGMHQSILDDFDNQFFVFDEHRCRSCAKQAAYGRVVAERDDKMTPKDRDGNPAWAGPRVQRPDDGRQLRLRRMTPDEVETVQERKG